MKKLFIVVIMLIAVILTAQEELKVDLFNRIKSFGLEFIEIYDIYEKDCYADTIKAINFREEEDLYLIPMGDVLQEVITIENLENRGYKYRYPWVTDISIDSDGETVLEVEYIFTKEPSLKGFAEWLRIKTKEKK